MQLEKGTQQPHHLLSSRTQGLLLFAPNLRVSAPSFEGCKLHHFVFDVWAQPAFD
jgi:hypothetical protein